MSQQYFYSVGWNILHSHGCIGLLQQLKLLPLHRIIHPRNIQWPLTLQNQGMIIHQIMYSCFCQGCFQKGNSPKMLMISPTIIDTVGKSLHIAIHQFSRFKGCPSIVKQISGYNQSIYLLLCCTLQQLLQHIQIKKRPQMNITKLGNRKALQLFPQFLYRHIIGTKHRFISLHQGTIKAGSCCYTGQYQGTLGKFPTGFIHRHLTTTTINISYQQGYSQQSYGKYLQHQPDGNGLQYQLSHWASIIPSPAYPQPKDRGHIHHQHPLLQFSIPFSPHLPLQYMSHNMQ